MGLYSNNSKELDLKKMMVDKDVDITCIQENNAYWNKIQGTHKIWTNFKVRKIRWL